MSKMYHENIYQTVRSISDFKRDMANNTVRNTFNILCGLSYVCTVDATIRPIYDIADISWSIMRGGE